MTKIYVITPYNPSCEDIHQNLKKFSPNSSGKWLDVETTNCFEKADYYIVFWCGDAEIRKNCPSGSVINIMREPSWHIPKKELIGEETIHSRWVTDSYIPSIWWVDKTYDELSTENFPEKRRDISYIATGRYLNRVKIKFIELMRSLQDTFPSIFDFIDIDTYKWPFPVGWNYRLDFTEKFCRKYPGILDLFGKNIGAYDLSQIPEYKGEIEDKWDGLASYRYSFAFENTSEKNYFTEKIIDCILAGSMPIYWGCPNLEAYFPKNSFIRLDITKKDAPQKAMEIIKSDYREENIDSLRKARELILNRYQFWPTINNIIENIEKKL